jgi:acetyltransferase-like isoleucine patch superfamily enzyme
MFYAVRRNWVKTSLYDESEGLKTIIGNDVLISANALIRNGVTIGHGAVVGAGAFVNDDVPPYAVVAGVPAKVIRYRFEDALIARLLKSEWWNLSDEKIRNAGNFNHPEKFLDAIGA